MTEREHEHLLATVTDRFERRLAEESSKTRGEIGEVRREINAVRIAMVEGDNATRLEIAAVRVDMTQQFAAARVESEGRHRELLKWAFVFWVGQATAMIGILRAFMT